MKKVLIKGLHLWHFENLTQATGIKHFVTDRSTVQGGKEFTLSFSSSPNKTEILNNRKLLATAMGLTNSHIHFPEQVHKTRIVHVTSNTTKEELMETDALVTQQEGLCIAVMSADCVPILLYDKKNNAVAAVHSGWRGTVAGILEKTLNEMHARFGTKGEDLIAGIGPSVCQDSYEVGEEVIDEVIRAFGKGSGLMIDLPNQKAKLDLWKANKLYLLKFGVKESAIEIANLCTVKNNSNFFSARKGDTGRFAAGIMLI
jgi:YfiH family protein